MPSVDGAVQLLLFDVFRALWITSRKQAQRRLSVALLLSMFNATNSNRQASVPAGPPYPATYAVLGGVPAVKVDDPVCGVLLFLFVLSAAAHMTVLQLNRRLGLKFMFSGMLFALCFLRSAALSMRIVWASSPHNVNIAIAANILTQAGSVLVFLTNLVFSQRIVRAYHPRFGWTLTCRLFFRTLLACVVLCLIMLIVVTIQSFFTLDVETRQADHIAQLFAGTYMALLAFLPIPIVLLARYVPRGYDLEKFGRGRWRTKIRLLVFTAILATLGAGFRVGTNYNTRPISDPGWARSRACYYIFNYAIDFIVSTTYLLSRFDHRFVIPNGAKGPGDYSKGRAMPFALAQGRPATPDNADGQEQPANGSSVSSEQTTAVPSANLEEGRTAPSSKDSAKRSTRDFGSQTMHTPPPTIARRSREADILELSEMTITGGNSPGSPNEEDGQSHHRGRESVEEDFDIPGAEKAGNLDDMLEKISTIPSRAGSTSSTYSRRSHRDQEPVEHVNVVNRPPLPPLDHVYFHRNQQNQGSDTAAINNLGVDSVPPSPLNSSIYTAADNGPPNTDNDSPANALSPRPVPQQTIETPAAEDQISPLQYPEGTGQRDSQQPRAQQQNQQQQQQVLPSQPQTGVQRVFPLVSSPVLETPASPPPPPMSPGALSQSSTRQSLMSGRARSL